MIGARAPSAISIDVFGPSRCTTEPAGMPSSAIGTSCAAKTNVIRVGEPVVTSTNHGRARYVSCDPSREMSSPASSAAIDRSRITPPPARRS
jgi:hypothetical protein